MKAKVTQKHSLLRVVVAATATGAELLMLDVTVTEESSVCIVHFHSLFFTGEALLPPH